VEKDIQRIVSGDLKFKSEVWIKENLSTLHSFILKNYTNHSFKEGLYCHINSINQIPKCECGNSLEFISLSKGWRKFCSVKCQTNSKSINQKRKETLIKKWGVDNPMKSREIKLKFNQIILEKWGVDNISKLESTKDKVKKTNLEKWGVEYISQLDHVKSSLSKKMKKKSRELNDIRLKNLEKTISQKIQEFGIKFISFEDTSLYNMSHGDHHFQIHKNTLNDRIKWGNTICTVCNKIESGSDSEKQLLGFIRDNYRGEIIENDRKTIGLEIDVLIPELKLGFEYNGLYWHSDIYKSKNYHQQKTQRCQDIGIKLITIWEDDWKFKTDIVKSRILNLLGGSKKIWARNCEIREVSDAESKKFIESNHIQGHCISKFRLGLFHLDRLVSLMTFGKLRKSLGNSHVDGNWELLRFCNLIGYSVVGGASKLISEFIRKYKPVKIISYADRSWSSGALYRRLGFKFIGDTHPNYYWVVNGVRRNRFNFRKDRLVKEGFDPDKSESQIMKDRGYWRIWDSGSTKWSLEINI